MKSTQEKIRKRLVALAVLDAKALNAVYDREHLTWNKLIERVAVNNILTLNVVERELPGRFFGTVHPYNRRINKKSEKQYQHDYGFHPCWKDLHKKWLALGLDITTLQLTKETDL